MRKAAALSACVWLLAGTVVATPLASAAVASEGRIRLSPPNARKAYPATATSGDHTHVAWPDDSADTLSGGVQVRRVDGSGNVVSGTGVTTRGIFYQPKIAASGRYVYVAWAQNQSLTQPEAFATTLAWSNDFGQSFQTMRISDPGPSVTHAVDPFSISVAAAGERVLVAWKQMGSVYMWSTTFGFAESADPVLLGRSTYHMAPSAATTGAVDLVAWPNAGGLLQLTRWDRDANQLTTTSLSNSPVASAPLIAAEGDAWYVAWVNRQPVSADTVRDTLVLKSGIGADNSADEALDQVTCAQSCIESFDLDVYRQRAYAAWATSQTGTYQRHGLDVGTLQLSPIVKIADAVNSGPDIEVGDTGIHVAFSRSVGSTASSWLADVFVASRTHSQNTFSIRNLTDTPEDASWTPSLSGREDGFALAWMEWEEFFASNYGYCCAIDYQAGTVADQDLELLDSEVVQAPYGYDKLADGKPSAIRIKVRNGFATSQVVPIRISYEFGQVSETVDLRPLVKPGQQEVFYPSHGDPPLLPKGPDGSDLLYAVHLDPEGEIAESVEAANNSDSGSYKIKDTKPFFVLFVPIETPGDSQPAPDCNQMKALMKGSKAYLDAVLPVDPTETLYSVMCGTALNVPVDGPDKPLNDEQLDERVFNRLDAMNWDDVYDAVIGVPREGWFRDNTIYPGFVGAANQGGWQSSVIAEAQGTGGWEVAHEISHQLGWVSSGHPSEDTTSDANKNHLVPTPAPGYWVTRGVRVGEKVDWMYNSTRAASLQDATGRWISPYTYDFFLKHLAFDPVDPPLISLRARVNDDGSVDAPPWYAGDGFLDAALGDTGDYEIRYLDGTGALLATTGIDGASVVTGGGEASHSSAPLPYVDLAASIPDVPGTATVQIVRDGSVLFARSRSAAAPQVAVTSANGGEIWRVGEEVTITWDASDADGDQLHSVVSLSTDGGASWLPLASDVTGTSLPLTVTRSMIGDQAMVKVVTTDGLNGASDVSDAVFTIERGNEPARILFSAGNHYPRACTGGSFQYCYAPPYSTHDIYAFGPDGADVVQLTNTSTRPELDPEWSPDGSKIAYALGGTRPAGVYEEPEPADIYVMDDDGLNATQVTATPSANESSPTWAPDGSQLAFERNGVGVFVADANGQNEQLIAEGGSDPKWSPVDDRILFERNDNSVSQIWSINSDGTGATILDEAVVSWGDRVFDPNWSSDGDSIVYVLRQRYNLRTWEDLVYRNLTTGSSRTTRFSDRGQERRFTGPEYSPDGSQVMVTDAAEGTPLLLPVDDLWSNGTALTGVGRPVDGHYSWRPGFAVADPEPPDPEPPLADAGGPYTASEAGEFTLDGSGSTGAAPLTLDWDLDGDGDFSDASGQAPTTAFGDDGEFGIGVRVTDATGVFSTDTATVTVGNVAPEISAPLAVMEPDGTASLSARAMDVPADVLSATVDWGDGTPVEDVAPVPNDEGASILASHSYGAPGDYQVILTVSDDDGGTDQAIMAVTRLPENNAPTANDIQTSTPNSAAVEIGLSGADEDGDPIAFEIVDPPQHGELFLAPSFVAPSLAEKVIYQPDGAFTGTDSFTYRASDLEDYSEPAVVSIQLTGEDGGGEPEPPPSGPNPGPQPTPTPAPTPTPTPTPEPPVRSCTVRGTPDADRLEGTDGADVLCGLGGDDVIVGLEGDDRLVGGPGDDTMFGGVGDDELLGRGGDDSVRGGRGLDLLMGGSGRDELHGGREADLLEGGRGEDRMLGGAGNDQLTGGPLADANEGGPGTDSCAPGALDTFLSCESARRGRAASRPLT